MFLVPLAILNVVSAITTDESDYGYFVDILDHEEVSTPPVSVMVSSEEPTTIKRQTAYLDLSVPEVKKSKGRFWEFLRR